MRTTRPQETESGTTWSVRDNGFASRCFQRGPKVELSSMDLIFLLDSIQFFSGEIELLGGPVELGGAVMEGNVYIDGNPVFNFSLLTSSTFF